MSACMSGTSGSGVLSSTGDVLAGMPKTVNRAPIARGGEAQHNLHSSLSPL